MLDGDGEVEVGWAAQNGRLEVWVRDGGPGFAETTNLFVPFFATKPDGSGIGLVLSRQIAEAARERAVRRGGRDAAQERGGACGGTSAAALAEVKWADSESNREPTD